MFWHHYSLDHIHVSVSIFVLSTAEWGSCLWSYFHQCWLWPCVTVAGWTQRAAPWRSRVLGIAPVHVLRVCWPAFRMWAVSIITRASMNVWGLDCRPGICSHRTHLWSWFRSTATNMHTIWSTKIGLAWATTFLPVSYILHRKDPKKYDFVHSS